MNLRIKGKAGSFTLETDLDVVNIGRSVENDFVIPLDDFSRKHCQVTFKGEYAFIKDLGSKNGVIIDGRRIAANEQVPIYPNTVVIIANHFQLILPNGSTAVHDISKSVMELTLDLPVKKGR